MIKSVIFDLDGTLIDSMQVWYKVDREFLLESGVKNPPPEISEKVKKMTIFESSALFINEFNLKCSQDYVIRRIEELVRIEYEEKIQLKPYVIETLDFLDKINIPYCIATATYKSLAESVLKRCGIIDRFAFMLTDIDYPKGKKFPDIFLGAAEKMGTLPDNTLVAEDSLHCIETASKAGFRTVAVYDKASEKDRDKLIRTADYYINSLDKIGGIICV